MQLCNSNCILRLQKAIPSHQMFQLEGGENRVTTYPQWYGAYTHQHYIKH